MKPANVFVYGAGGHGKVVADLLLACGLRLAAFIDDNPSRSRDRVLGYPVFSSEWLKGQSVAKPVAVALGIGDNAARQAVMHRCLAAGIEVLTAVHPKAAVAGSARIGRGTVVMAGAVINAEAQVGEGVVINSGALVEHDSTIGAFAHISPNAAMGGAVRIGAMSHVGLGAVVLPGIDIGEATLIGAGAVVVRDMPNHVVAIGVPARIARSIPPRRPGRRAVAVR